ncbi:MAG: EamA family transporter, partial [Rhodobacteraceae bacterium]|nr:EamA family transporter [Paracoccaceae bacterium]
FIWPSFGEIKILMVGIASGVTAYYLLVGATRYGDASLIAPFRYSRLVFALLLSILILGERPDLMTWLGAFIVVFSGYFIVLRERNIKNLKK